jgi:uroporphyrinogen-III synthase
VKVAAIGPGTAAALGARGIRPDLVPERFVAESLLEAFPDPAGPAARVLLARAEQARDVLPEGLAARGYRVDVLPVYRTDPAAPDPSDVAAVAGGTVDAITFTSSSTVANFCDAVGPLPEPQPLVASIGPVTSETARARGLQVGVEADPHTVDGLVDALVTVLGTIAR